LLTFVVIENGHCIVGLVVALGIIKFGLRTGNGVGADTSTVVLDDGE
jgi:hypothetical protein